MESVEPRRTACDMLSDCVFAIGLEAAFWIDVFRTTMQWDEESVIRNAEERLKQFQRFETGGKEAGKKRE